jgi:energy-coupling factor transport system ATP-binding protein
MNAIDLDQVSFTYADAATPALRNVSLHVQQGEMMVIMGASGAGKSTLLKCLNRVIPAFHSGQLSGTVRLFGRALTVEKVGELAGTVGMVLQDFEAQLFSTTVRDEVVFGMEQLGVEPSAMRDRFDEVLAQVGLQGFASRDPTTLSGGEKQRLAIAALLALRPRILVLDEPTSDLDPQGRQEVFSLLGRMRGQGYTLVLVEHEIAAATEADHIVILADGAVVAAGPPELVLPRIGMLARYGVRPHDMDRLFQLLGVEKYPRDIDAAAETLRENNCGLAIAEYGLKNSSIPQSTIHNPQSESFLYLQSVTHLYPDTETPAVHDVSLTINEGEFIALLGQNGSGKTTLAKHLSGLLAPTRGEVLLRGQALSRMPLHTLAQQVSYVFQNPDHQLFAATVEEEVAFGPRQVGLVSGEVDARVDEALETVGLQDLRYHDPFLLGKGERQRLAVAALLALQPRLLILDEPTTGLDYVEQQRMMELLRRLHRQGRTIIVITHVPWIAAEYAERALLMAQGRVLWDGSLRDLCAQPALCARAAFRPPDATLLGLRLGVTPLSVEEFVAWVHRSRAPSLRKADS